jgi:hypothetical protein
MRARYGTPNHDTGDPGWNPTPHSPAEVVDYLSATIENAKLDREKAIARACALENEHAEARSLVNTLDAHIEGMLQARELLIAVLDGGMPLVSDVLIQDAR